MLRSCGDSETAYDDTAAVGNTTVDGLEVPVGRECKHLREVSAFG